MPGRSRHDVVADALDVEVGIAPQHGRDMMGDGGLAATHRVNGDERERVVQSAHVATPCSRKMSFSATLLWRSPSLMRRMMSTHGKKNSPPANSRLRFADTATQ